MLTIMSKLNLRLEWRVHSYKSMHIIACHLSLAQFQRALKRIYLIVSAGPSDFLFLSADYK